MHFYPSMSSCTHNPGFKASNLDQKWNFRAENRFRVWNWKSWWGNESTLCIQVFTPVQTRLKKNAKEDGWNKEKYNTAMEHDVRRLKESGESETEVIVFGWFLLDFVPTKLNKFSGIGGKRDDKMWWKERRYRWKSGEERKRQKESVIPQRSITRHCELWYLLHQVPCGFIALGQCFEKERDY